MFPISRNQTDKQTKKFKEKKGKSVKKKKKKKKQKNGCPNLKHFQSQVEKYDLQIFICETCDAQQCKQNFVLDNCFAKYKNNK